MIRTITAAIISNVIIAIVRNRAKFSYTLCIKIKGKERYIIQNCIMFSKII